MSSSVFPVVTVLNNALLNTATREKAFVVGGNLSWYGGVWTDVGGIWYYQGNSQSWNTFNISTSSGNLLSLLAAGESVTATALITQGSTGYLPSQFYVDNAAVTVKWAGGSAPTASSNAIDALTFTVIKTPSLSTVVLGSFTKFA